jgi:hypothetical protein
MKGIKLSGGPGELVSIEEIEITELEKMGAFAGAEAVAAKGWVCGGHCGPTAGRICGSTCAARE